MFKAVLSRQYLPPAWKHGLGIHTKAGKGTEASFFLGPLVYILLTRFLQEGNELRLLGDEQFGLAPTVGTTLQLARLLKRVKRNSDEKR
jgi:hypothetical protein